MCIFPSHDLGVSKVLRDFENDTQMHRVNALDVYISPLDVQQFKTCSFLT